MRKYFIHTALAVLLIAMFGVQLLAPSIAGSSIKASVEIKPKTLNLKENKGGVITAFIEFTDPSYDVSDIDCNNIELHVETAPGWAGPISCIVADGVLVARFDASEVAGLFRITLGHMQPIPPPKVEYPKSIVVKGTVNGVDFEGSDRIRIILP